MIECDIKGCRKRSKVLEVEIEVNVFTVVNGVPKTKTLKKKMQLCPDHHRLKAEQRTALLSVEALS